MLNFSLDQPLKKQEAYENFAEMSKKNYKTDYLYHQKFYQLIGIDLTRQNDTIIPQQRW